MATILKIKRSSTNPTATPSGLGQGELAYGEGTSTYTDAQGATVTSYGKLFVGKGTETGGVAAGLDIIGGKYFTDLLDHGHGTITANSAAIVDSANKVDEWNVDNITLNGNTISTTDSNGNLTIDTDGTGDVIVSGSTTVGDNLFKINDGSTDRFVVDSFSGALDITTPALSAADTVLNINSTWNNASNVFKGIDFDVIDTASSANSRLLELSVGGSTKFDVDKDGNVSLTGTVDGRDIATDGSKLDGIESGATADQTAAEIRALVESANDSNVFTDDDHSKLNGIESGATADQTAAEIRALVESANDSNVFTDDDHSKLNGIESGATADQTAAEILTALLTVDGDTSGLDADLLDGVEAENFLRSDEDDIMSGHLTFADNKKAIFGTGLEIFYNSTTNNSVIKEIGTGILNIAADDNVNITNSGSSEFKAKFITNGAVELYYDNAKKFQTTSSGIGVIGTKLETSESTFELLDTNATTVSAFGAATSIDIGAASGTVSINNALVDLDGDLNVDGGDITTSLTSFNLLNTTATTVNFAGAATTVEIGANSGTTSINNDLDVDGDVNIDGGDLTTNQSTFNVINTNATTVNAFGAATTLNIGSASTEVDFGDLKIVGSTIYSDDSSVQTITIDPYPDGGDSGGNVVVRGNLQVSGTTTTVNSTQMTINDPVFTLGDSISEKTVTSAATSGQADVVLDDVEGLNVGDVVSGNAGIVTGTTIDSITGTTVTLSNNLTAGIAASTNTNPVTLTFTQGVDDNKDRGIEFKYYNGGLKQGFFGYDESGTNEGATTSYYFTYIPDATNTSQVFSGTVGKAYFDTVKLEIGTDKGIPFFDQYKRLTRTDAAGTSDATTSYQILTVDASGVPVWTTTIDGGTY